MTSNRPRLHLGRWLSIRRFLIALCTIAIVTNGLDQWTLYSNINEDLPELMAPPKSLPPRTTAPTAKKETRAYQSINNISSSQHNIKRIDNVLLQGQFNHVMPLERIVFWFRTWSRYFSNILIVGPLSNTTRNELERLGIPSRWGKIDEDVGAVAPYENLRNTLLEYQDDPNIDGVLTIHDDALVNLTQMTKGQHSFPLDTIIGTFPSSAEREKRAYRIHPPNKDSNGAVTFSNLAGQQFHTAQQLKQSLPEWERWNGCIKAQVAMVWENTPGLENYFEKDGSLLIPGYGQSDVLFVPTKYAKEFADAAELHMAQDTWLECAVPTIVYMMQKRTNVKVRRVGLCTSWQYKTIRGKPRMIQKCVQRQLRNKAPSHAVYHPFKISQGLELWQNMLDRVQRSDWTTLDDLK